MKGGNIKMGKFDQLVKSAWNTYLNNKLVNMNVNILATAGIATVASTYCTELAELVTEGPNALTAVGTISNILTFIPTRGVFHYYSNLDLYRNEEGKIMWRKYFKDITKIYATGAPGMFLFFTVYTAGQNLFYRLGISPRYANPIASITGNAASRTLHTYLAIWTKIFKKSN